MSYLWYIGIQYSSRCDAEPDVIQNRPQNSIALDVMPQNPASHIAVIEEFHRKIKLKFKITPEALKNESGLIKMIIMGKSDCHKLADMK